MNAVQVEVFPLYTTKIDLVRLLRQENPRRGFLNVAHREPASKAKTGVTVGIMAK